MGGVLEKIDKAKKQIDVIEKAILELKKVKDKLANENDLVTLRSEPKLVSTVESWGNIELSNNDFSFVDEPKNLGIFRKKVCLAHYSFRYFYS